MTTLAQGSPLGGPRHGGMAARRAVVRWAGRMFRREWRQQLLVVTLLTVAVTGAIGSITIASNAVPADDGDFGSANLVLTFDGSDPQRLQAGLDAARRSFGSIEVIGHRSARVPGDVEKVDYRSQVPDGPFGDDLLALRRGSYPTGPDQVAVTDGVAESLRLRMGSILALDGRRRTVVGIVENPSKLSDEFALISPSSARPDGVSVLVEANAASRESFYRSQGDGPNSAFAGSIERGSDVSSAARDAGDLLRGHRLPPARLVGCGSRVRSRRAATAPAARHARSRRRDAEAPPPRAGDERCRRRGDRRRRRDGRRSRALGRLRTHTRVRSRPSHRPSQPSLGTDHDGRPPHRPGGNRSGLVARANGLPTSRHARALGAAAHAEARTALGDRGRGLHRGRHRLSRTVRPRPTTAHRRRTH